MRFASSLIGIALASLTGCSFDFKGLASSDGGAGGTGVTHATGIGSTVGPGPGATSTNVGSTASVGPATSVSSVSATTNATTVDVAASSSTGGPVELVPCSPVDHFDTISAAWSQIGTITNNGNKVQATANGSGRGGLELASGQTSYSECYVSIEITTPASPNTALVSLGITDAAGGPSAGSNNDSVTFLASLSTVYAPGTAGKGGQNSQRLGIAFHNDKIYYLAADDNSWVLVSSTNLDGWLQDNNVDYFFFGVGLVSGWTAEFDNFNVHAIHLSDLQ